MKPHGSTAIYERERARDLTSIYNHICKQCETIDPPKILYGVINLPAPRFYISPERATRVIRQIIAGDDLCYMRHNKREMFFEIYRRAKPIMKRKPDIPLQNIIEDIIEQKAPRFYITVSSAIAIIRKQKKLAASETLRRLLHLSNP